MPKPTREYIYGINPAFEVIRGGRRTVYQAFINEATVKNPRLKKLATYLEKSGIEIELVSKQRLFELAQTKEHQGVVLKTRPYPYVDFEEMLEQPRLLLLDNVEDPHNVGAILRSAEVFGFHHVLLPLKGVPNIYPSVVKVSAGASEHLQIARSCSANQYARKAQAAGYTVVALDAKGETPLQEIADMGLERLLLVVGGEAKAVGQFILNLADYTAGIPQHGRVNSLNASVAAGIAMLSLTSKNPS